MTKDLGTTRHIGSARHVAELPWLVEPRSNRFSLASRRPDVKSDAFPSAACGRNQKGGANMRAHCADVAA